MPAVESLKFIKRVVLFLADLICLVISLPILTIYALIYKSKESGKSRVGWGPTPIKPIHYNSLALKSVGISSCTFVDELYSINNRNDFDVYYSEKPKKSYFYRPFKIFFRVKFFIEFLKRCDVLITNFDGALLRGSMLRYFEHFFLNLGNKKLIVWPYGSDSFIYSKVSDQSFRYGLYKSYPLGAQKEKIVSKQIEYFCKHAQLIVGNIPHHEALPRWDIFSIACYCVDTSEWIPSNSFTHKGNGKDAEVKILHCPNHRDVKGTKFIIEAVSQLQQEGYKINLFLLENLKNEEILEKMRQCDIVVAQQLYGYAATEIEGMSLSKPVISNLSFPNYYEPARVHTYFRECPIVSCSPLTLKMKILELVNDPQKRTLLGQQGRTYVEKYHSFRGQGKFWSYLVQAARTNKLNNLDDWWLDQ